MRKLVSLVCIISTLAVGLVGCGSKNNTNSATAEIALVPATGSVDDKSFNQGAWEGVQQYSKEKGISAKYYKPADSSETRTSPRPPRKARCLWSDRCRPDARPR